MPEDTGAEGATKEATEPTLGLKQPTHEQEQRTRNRGWISVVQD